eukprot:6195631-Pleurochrysis_carterae.AAC.1
MGEGAGEREAADLLKEANRQASEQALSVARRKYEEGDDEAAVRFAAKSLKLYPLDEANKYLSWLQRFGAASEAAAAVKRVLEAEDHYEVFGVTQQRFDGSSLKSLYRQLSLALHPDKNHARGAERAFQRLSEAHGVLSDAALRSKYDVELHMKNLARGPHKKKPPPQPRAYTQSHAQSHTHTHTSTHSHAYTQQQQQQQQQRQQEQQQQQASQHSHHQQQNQQSSGPRTAFRWGGKGQYEAPPTQSYGPPNKPNVGSSTEAQLMREVSMLRTKLMEAMGFKAESASLKNKLVAASTRERELDAQLTKLKAREQAWRSEKGQLLEEVDKMHKLWQDEKEAHA